MEWKIASIILIGLLIGLGVGYTVAYEMYCQDHSGDLNGIQDQLNNLQSRLSQVNSTLSTLAPPTWNVVSMAENFSWTNPDTGFGFYDINCFGFSRMFVYVTIDRMNPPTGNTTTFWLTQVIWHLYPSNSSLREWTWSRQDVTPETLNITAYPSDNFNGTDTRSQGGAQFTTIGQFADLSFNFNSTTPSGWAIITCSIYLRN